MPFSKNFRTPGQLTGAARGAFDAVFDSFGIAALLPINENFTLDYNFTKGAAPLPPAAKFRSFNTRSMVNTVGQGATASGKLPPTSIRLYVDEYQQLKMYGQNDAIGAKFQEYAERNAQSIAFRVVMAAAEAIEKGTVTLEERGLSLVIDFGRREDNTADAAISWGAANDDPIFDLEAMKKAFGKRISTIRMSDISMGHLQRSENLIKTALQRGTDLPGLISQEQVRATLRDYGYGEIVIDEDVVMNTEGEEVPLFSEDAVIFTSGGQVGTTEIGVTAESLASDNGIAAAEAPGLFAGAIAVDDPTGYDVLVSGILLPVLTAPNNTAVLTV